MFDLLNSKTVFKMLAATGAKIHFDLDRQALIITTDDGEQVHLFADIEKMVNGDG